MTTLEANTKIRNMGYYHRKKQRLEANNRYKLATTMTLTLRSGLVPLDVTINANSTLYGLKQEVQRRWGVPPSHQLYYTVRKDDKDQPERVALSDDSMHLGCNGIKHGTSLVFYIKL